VVRRKRNVNKNVDAKRRKRAQKRAIARRGYVPQVPKFYLSGCARLYLHALINPFEDLMTSELPCIPDVITLPSYKLHVYARGTMVVGAQGVGYVLFDPFTLVSNTATSPGSTSSYPVIYTGATYNSSTIDWQPSGGAFPTGVSGAVGNSVFGAPSAALQSGQMRLVGGGIRIRYSGNELYRGGSIIAYRQQGNINIPTGSSTSNLLDSPLSARAPVNRSWHQVNYLPDETLWLEYKSFGTTYDVTETGASHYSLLLAVTAPIASASATQQTFDWEASCFYELIGSNLTLTPSHSDPVGVGAIRAATSQSTLMTTSPAVEEKSILNQIMNTAWESVSGLASFAGSKALEYGSRVATKAATRAVTQGMAAMLL